MSIVFTTAPAAYDGFETVTIEPRVGNDQRGLVVRKVQIADTDFDWQVGRYRSGLHGVYTEAEVEEMFISGLWKRAS